SQSSRLQFLVVLKEAALLATTCKADLLFSISREWSIGFDMLTRPAVEETGEGKRRRWTVHRLLTGCSQDAQHVRRLASSLPHAFPALAVSRVLPAAAAAVRSRRRPGAQVDNSKSQPLPPQEAAEQPHLRIIGSIFTQQLSPEVPVVLNQETERLSVSRRRPRRPQLQHQEPRHRAGVAGRAEPVQLLARLRPDQQAEVVHAGQLRRQDALQQSWRAVACKYTGPKYVRVTTSNMLLTDCKNCGKFCRVRAHSLREQPLNVRLLRHAHDGVARHGVAGVADSRIEGVGVQAGRQLPLRWSERQGAKLQASRRNLLRDPVKSAADLTSSSAVSRSSRCTRPNRIRPRSCSAASRNGSNSQPSWKNSTQADLSSSRTRAVTFSGPIGTKAHGMFGEVASIKTVLESGRLSWEATTTLPAGQVPHLDGLVRAAGGDLLAVRVHSQRHHPVGVAAQSCNQLAFGHAEHLHVGVIRHGDQVLAVRGELQRPDRHGVADQSVPQLAGRQVQHVDDAIHRASGQQTTVGAVGQAHAELALRVQRARAGTLFPEDTSNKLTLATLLPVASSLPSGENLTVQASTEPASMKRACLPLCRSQIRICASIEELAARVPSRLVSTEMTPRWWPSRVCSSSQWSTDQRHTLTRSSSEPVTRKSVRSGLAQATDQMLSSCAFSCRYFTEYMAAAGSADRGEGVRVGQRINNCATPELLPLVEGWAPAGSSGRLGRHALVTAARVLSLHHVGQLGRRGVRLDVQRREGRVWTVADDEAEHCGQLGSGRAGIEAAVGQCPVVQQDFSLILYQLLVLWRHLQDAFNHFLQLEHLRGLLGVQQHRDLLAADHKKTNFGYTLEQKVGSTKGYALGARTAPRFRGASGGAGSDTGGLGPGAYHLPDNYDELQREAARDRELGRPPFLSATQRFPVFKRDIFEVNPSPGNYEHEVQRNRKVQWQQSFGGTPTNLPSVQQKSTLVQNTDKTFIIRLHNEFGNSDCEQAMFKNKIVDISVRLFEVQQVPFVSCAFFQTQFVYGKIKHKANITPLNGGPGALVKRQVAARPAVQVEQRIARAPVWLGAVPPQLRLHHLEGAGGLDPADKPDEQRPGVGGQAAGQVAAQAVQKVLRAGGRGGLGDDGGHAGSAFDAGQLHAVDGAVGQHVSSREVGVALAQHIAQHLLLRGGLGHVAVDVPKQVAAHDAADEFAGLANSGQLAQSGGRVAQRLSGVLENEAKAGQGRLKTHAKTHLIDLDQLQRISPGRDDAEKSHSSHSVVQVNQIAVGLRGAIKLGHLFDAEAALEFAPNLRPQPVAEHQAEPVALVGRPAGLSQQVTAELADVLRHCAAGDAGGWNADAENFRRITTVAPRRNAWPTPRMPPAVWYSGRQSYTESLGPMFKIMPTVLAIMANRCVDEEQPVLGAVRPKLLPRRHLTGSSRQHLVEIVDTVKRLSHAVAVAEAVEPHFSEAGGDFLNGWRQFGAKQHRRGLGGAQTVNQGLSAQVVVDERCHNPSLGHAQPQTGEFRTRLGEQGHDLAGTVAGLQQKVRYLWSCDGVGVNRSRSHRCPKDANRVSKAHPIRVLVNPSESPNFVLVPEADSLRLLGNGLGEQLHDAQPKTRHPAQGAERPQQAAGGAKIARESPTAGEGVGDKGDGDGAEDGETAAAGGGQPVAGDAACHQSEARASNNAVLEHLNSSFASKLQFPKLPVKNCRSKNMASATRSRINVIVMDIAVTQQFRQAYRAAMVSRLADEFDELPAAGEPGAVAAADTGEPRASASIGAEELTASPQRGGSTPTPTPPSAATPCRQRRLRIGATSWLSKATTPPAERQSAMLGIMCHWSRSGQYTSQERSELTPSCGAQRAALTVHWRHAAPLPGAGVEQLDSVQPVLAVVAADGVQPAVEHRHAHPAAVATFERIAKHRVLADVRQQAGGQLRQADAAKDGQGGRLALRLAVAEPAKTGLGQRLELLGGGQLGEVLGHVGLTFGHQRLTVELLSKSANFGHVADRQAGAHEVDAGVLDLGDLQVAGAGEQLLNAEGDLHLASVSKVDQQLQRVGLDALHFNLALGALLHVVHEHAVEERNGGGQDHPVGGEYRAGNAQSDVTQFSLPADSLEAGEGDQEQALVAEHHAVFQVGCGHAQAGGAGAGPQVAGQGRILLLSAA
uniref:ANK_REP_REGION domain-containing protein n=1 Tax=Macrostomum lignano TaxID=282301 RepID=A0A1I8HWL7_9PLAT